MSYFSISPQLCAALLVSLSTVCPLLHAAQADKADLNTLFYTPLERQAIALARKGSPDEVQQATSVFQYQGIVRRGAGKNTLWINGKSLPEGARQTPQTHGFDAVVEGARLRVGQSIDSVSGQRSDVVVPGAVTVNSPKPK